MALHLSYAILFILSSLKVLNSVGVGPFCCAGILHDFTSGICCNNVYYEKAAGIYRVECCGSKTFENPKELCCNGTVVTNKFDSSGGCCGKQVFDRSQNRCCGSTLYPANTDQLCCNNKIVNNKFKINGKCCGTEIYDETQKRCCGTVVKVLNMNQSCCGNDVYDRSLAFCSFTKEKNAFKVVAIPKGLIKPALCNVAVHDSNKTFCCSQAIIDRPKVAGNYSCCGSKLYDTDNEICCNPTKSIIKKPGGTSSVIYQCCNDQPFNPNDKICCKNVLSNVKEGFSCCGSSTYNLTTSVCCKEQIQLKTAVGSKKDCCNGTLYDPNLSDCCQNKILKKPAEGKCNRECFDTFFDPIPIGLSVKL